MMEVLLKIGADAGKIRDVKPIYARQMIADGRASDPHAEIVPDVAAAPALNLSMPAVVSVPVVKVKRSPR